MMYTVAERGARYGLCAGAIITTILLLRDPKKIQETLFQLLVGASVGGGVGYVAGTLGHDLLETDYAGMANIAYSFFRHRIMNNPQPQLAIIANVNADAGGIDNEGLTPEEQFINNHPQLLEYYETMTTNMSSILLAAFVVKSGYVDVNNSKMATTMGLNASVLDAIPLPEPFSNLATPLSAMTKYCNFIDSSHREALLLKIVAFFMTNKKGEAFIEKLALNLVRARFHANTELSKAQAEKDMQTLICLIESAEPPMSINRINTMNRVLTNVMGTDAYVLDPLPAIQHNNQQLLGAH